MSSSLKITSLCILCDNCKLICPEKAILKLKDQNIIETWSCTMCGLCIEICPTNSIKFINENSEEITS